MIEYKNRKSKKHSARPPPPPPPPKAKLRKDTPRKKPLARLSPPTKPKQKKSKMQLKHESIQKNLDDIQKKADAFRIELALHK